MRIIRITLYFVCFVFVFICSPANLNGATLVVTNIADSTNGTCDINCSLRDAVSAANDGDTITFGSQFNTPTTITLLQGQILIAKSLTIAGPGSSSLSISGNNAGRIFRISDGAVVSLSGMTLRDGRIGANANDVFGGGILVTDSTLSLTNMVLRNNTASFSGTNPTITLGFGGAIAIYNSVLSVTTSRISNNNGHTFGGIYSTSGIVSVVSSTIASNTGIGLAASQDDTLNISTSTISGNKVGVSGSIGTKISINNSLVVNNELGVENGGGMLQVDQSSIESNCCSGGISNRGTAIIRRTRIRSNTRSILPIPSGGAIFNDGTLNLIESTLSGNNSTSSGAGIYNTGRIFVTNSTISGNSVSTGRGGGLFNNLNGYAIFTNCTIANNFASGMGGGISIESTATTVVRNTLLASNTITGGIMDVQGTVQSQGFNLISNTQGSAGWIASDLLNQNAMLAPLGNNGGTTQTHGLMPGSPAINSGSNSLAVDPFTENALTRDQRGNGFGRIIGGGQEIGITDVGAYESNISGSPVSLSGRILAPNGMGISRSKITLTDSNGMIVIALSSSLGYYRFTGLAPGMSYTILVTHKSFNFGSPQLITLDTNRSDFNVYAIP